VGVGILVLLVLSVIEVGIVSIFDPGLDTLGARLAAQALLAATLIGIAFTVSSDHGFPGTSVVPRWTLGLRPSLRSRGATFATAGAALLWGPIHFETAAGEIVSVGLFYKHFNDPIEQVYLGTSGTRIISYLNAESARNIGVELELRKNLGMLGEGFLPWSFFADVQENHAGTTRWPWAGCPRSTARAENQLATTQATSKCSPAWMF
jgi:hypothetical protein